MQTIHTGEKNFFVTAMIFCGDYNSYAGEAIQTPEHLTKNEREIGEFTWMMTLKVTVVAMAMSLIELDRRLTMVGRRISAQWSNRRPSLIDRKLQWNVG